MIVVYYIPLLVEVCVVVLADISFALLFLKTPRLREGPGQLVLAQTQAQIIVDLHWLIFYYDGLKDSTTTCKALTSVAYLGFTVSCTYAAAICVAVSLHFDRPKCPNLWRYHMAVIAISLSLSLVMFLGAGEKIPDYSFCFNRDYDQRSWTG